MLSSVIFYFLSHTTPALRRLGLVGESLALRSRALRQTRYWQPHEQQCHAVIQRVLATLPRSRKLVVLGSGLLRDVPIDALCSRFSQVILVDAVHLPSVRWRMRGRNVTWITRDLSGVADWLLGNVEARTPPLADLIADPEVDLVISANLLSQLPIQPEDWLDRNEARAATLPQDLLSSIIRWHLEDLASFACPVCLLTDTKMIERDNTGNTTDTLDLMRGNALPAPDAQWEWTLAPKGEIDSDRSYHHTVFAFENLKASLAQQGSAP